jgi:hypothetical protein
MVKILKTLPTELFTSGLSLLSSARSSRTERIVVALHQLKSLISRFAVIVVEFFYSNKNVHARQQFPAILKPLPTDLSTQSVDNAARGKGIDAKPLTTRCWSGQFTR